jgi:hypothetical protein
MQYGRLVFLSRSFRPFPKKRAKTLIYVLVLYLIIHQQEKLVKEIGEKRREKRLPPMSKTPTGRF